MSVRLSHWGEVKKRRRGARMCGWLRGSQFLSWKTGQNIHRVVLCSFFFLFSLLIWFFFSLSLLFLGKVWARRRKLFVFQIEYEVARRNDKEKRIKEPHRSIPSLSGCIPSIQCQSSRTCMVWNRDAKLHKSLKRSICLGWGKPGAQGGADNIICWTRVCSLSQGGLDVSLITCS